MDFLDPDKRRRHKRRLFVGYFLVGIALVLAATIMFMLTYGYDVDRKTGQVIQNGLIFVDSNPEKSTIYLNGKENGTTDKRITVPAGTYTLELKRDGYRDWKRVINLEGSSIERMTYPVLFPKNLAITERQTYDTNPALATESPDRHWILVSQGSNVSKYDIYDANNIKSPATAISLPANLLSPAKTNESMETVEWSNDNRHVVLKHSFNNSIEFIMLDRENPDRSLNLNKTLNLNPSTISLRDKKFDTIYLYDANNNTLKFGDLKTNQVTTYQEGVLAYKSYSDTMVLFAAKNKTDANKVDIVLRDGNKDYLLRNGLAKDNYLVDISRYNNHWYAAIATTGKVFIYQDPMNQATASNLPSLFTTMLIDKPTNLSFSANTQFIMAQSGNKFAVYDAEANKRYYYQLGYDIAADNKALWMDGNRIIFNQNNKVVVCDFDGINVQELIAINNGTKPMFDRDYLHLYTISPSAGVKGKSALNFANLKVTQ